MSASSSYSASTLGYILEGTDKRCDCTICKDQNLNNPALEADWEIWGPFMEARDQQPNNMAGNLQSQSRFMRLFLTGYRPPSNHEADFLRQYVERWSVDHTTFLDEWFARRLERPRRRSVVSVATLGSLDEDACRRLWLEDQLGRVLTPCGYSLDSNSDSDSDYSCEAGEQYDEEMGGRG